MSRRKRKPGSLDWLYDDISLDETIQEREDYRRNREEELRRLEREHRLEILRQQGRAIDPKEFSPPSGIDGLGEPEPIPEPEEPEAADDAPGGAASAGFDTNEGDTNEADGGNIAEPPPPPPDTRSLGERLSFSIKVSEHGAFIVEHQLPEARAALSVSFEDWHSLPLPVESRPLPR